MMTRTQQAPELLRLELVLNIPFLCLWLQCLTDAWMNEIIALWEMVPTRTSKVGQNSTFHFNMNASKRLCLFPSTYQQARLLLPRNRMYPKMELLFGSRAPYWGRLRMGDLDKNTHITFQDIQMETAHGDINIGVCATFLSSNPSEEIVH